MKNLDIDMDTRILNKHKLSNEEIEKTINDMLSTFKWLEKAPVEKEAMIDLLRLGFEYTWVSPTAPLNAVDLMVILIKTQEHDFPTKVKLISILDVYCDTAAEIGKTIRKLEATIKEKDDMIKYLSDQITGSIKEEKNV